MLKFIDGSARPLQKAFPTVHFFQTENDAIAQQEACEDCAHVGAVMCFGPPDLIGALSVKQF